jgi:uncharacterized RmlC-like cupin family protein
MDRPTCKLIPSGSAYEGRQGLTYLAGLTGDTAQSQAICMTMATLPPGAMAKTHLHRGIETAVYVIEGEAEMFFGDRLEEWVRAQAGEYLYIPADMPHRVMNRSDGLCRAVVAHSSPNDQAGIVMLSELDAIHDPAAPDPARPPARPW